MKMRGLRGRAWILLLLLLSCTALEDGQESFVSQLKLSTKFCDGVLAKMDLADKLALRDLLQVYQMLDRRMRDQSHQLNYKKNPAQLDTEERKYMWKDPRTPEEVEKDYQSIVSQREAVLEKLRVLINRLQSSGVLEAEKHQAADISPCLMGRLNKDLFPDRPVVSFMLQYFKRPWMLDKIVNAIAGCKPIMPVELVVNVDHPSDIATWAQLSYNTSGMVVPVLSANVHEARAYNRLASMARGKYLVLMQDDEAPPVDCSWIKDMVTIFERWPQMGFVGLHTYQLNLLGGNDHDNRDMIFMDPETKIKMQFAMVCDYGPVAVRKTAFKSVGGVDETMSDPGVCGIWSDFELSVRMWAAGYQVSFMRLDGQRDDKPGSTHREDAVGPCWYRQVGVGKSVYDDRWSEEFRFALAMHVKELNYAVLTPIYKKCPFGTASGGCPPGVVPQQPG